MDWQNIILKIQEQGNLSQTQIAEALDKSQAWVSAVSLGQYQDLRWKDGQAVLALLQQVTTAALAITKGTKK